MKSRFLAFLISCVLLLLVLYGCTMDFVEHSSQIELSVPEELTEGIWIIGLLPDERIIEYVKNNANREIMQTVLRYTYDGNELSVYENVNFQGVFQGYRKGGDLNIAVDRNSEIHEYPNPTEMIDTALLEHWWKNNEVFRLVYYRFDTGGQYFLAVNEHRVIILNELVDPNRELPMSVDEVTSTEMVMRFASLFSSQQGESLVNILEPLVN